jgi:hypothetical protein
LKSFFFGTWLITTTFFCFLLKHTFGLVRLHSSFFFFFIHRINQRIYLSATMRFVTASAALLAAESISSVSADTESTVDLGVVTSSSVTLNQQQIIHVSERNRFHKDHTKHLERKGDYLLQQHKQSFTKITTARLKNNNQKDSSTLMEECDPTQADTGVLSCGGQGRYCMESTESSLGGYCQEENKQSAANTKTPGSRRQQVVGQLTIFEIADLFCNNPESTGLTVDCNCTVDFQAYSGEFACYFGPDCVDFTAGCEDDSFPLCSTEKLNAIMDSQTSYTYTSCYTQSMPLAEYKFEYCTTFSFNENDGPTCDIVVEGQTCNSW